MQCHEGMARVFVRHDADDLVSEAVRRIKIGSRKSKSRHLANKQAFLHFIAGVVSSLANNFSRHAEPRIMHLPVGDPENGLFYQDPPSPEMMKYEVEQRDLLRAILPALRFRLSKRPALLAELKIWERALASEELFSASDLAASCSPSLLKQVRKLLTERRVAATNQPPDFEF